MIQLPAGISPIRIIQFVFELRVTFVALLIQYAMVEFSLLRVPTVVRLRLPEHLLELWYLNFKLTITLALNLIKLATFMHHYVLERNNLNS